MRIVLIAAILLIAGGLAWFVNKQIESGKVTEVQNIVQTQVVTEASRSVVVAKRALGPGVLLKEADLEMQRFPEAAVRPEYLTDQTTPQLSALAGSVVRLEIAAGEPILTGKIVRPGERGYLAAVLRPGMKAVSVQVNDRSGIAGFVLPGDRVDVLLTQNINDKTIATEGSTTGSSGNTSRQVTETLIKNVRVLGAGINLAKPAEGASIKTDVLTLELTPKLAEVITLSAELGKLSFILNPLAKPVDEQDPAAVEAAKAAEESYPYLVSGVADGSYSYTLDVDASPLRTRNYSFEERIPVFRAENTARKSEDAKLKMQNDTQPVQVFRGATDAPKGGTTEAVIKKAFPEGTVNAPLGAAPQPLPQQAP